MNFYTNFKIKKVKKTIFYLLMLVFVLARSAFGQPTASLTADTQVVTARQKWILVVHGGAGGPVKGVMAPDLEKAYMTHLDEALTVGGKVLKSGGSSLDAVEAVVLYLENCPLFNAGKGAVLNAEGKAEMDAAIMDGQSGMAGAVAGVKIIKNPISAARRVMEKTKHVMLCGASADEFAKTQGLETVFPDYFITPQRLESWEKWKLEKHGTVGAVALDMNGNLAAATSTGGMTGKMGGRVGDTPIIGAGTYASNKTCAVSATGHGEFFIRNVVAYDLSAMMEYSKLPIDEAARIIVHEKLKNQDASGGLIGVDKDGNISMPFNTNAMFRGFVKSDGAKEVAIY